MMTNTFGMLKLPRGFQNVSSIRAWIERDRTLPDQVM